MCGDGTGVKKRLPLEGKLSPKVTDEVYLHVLRWLLTPHPALRATFPSRGRLLDGGTALSFFLDPPLSSAPGPMPCEPPRRCAPPLRGRGIHLGAMFNPSHYEVFLEGVSKLNAASGR